MGDLRKDPGVMAGKMRAVMRNRIVVEMVGTSIIGGTLWGLEWAHDRLTGKDRRSLDPRAGHVSQRLPVVRSIPPIHG
jgi:hypothetical protein